MKYFLVIAATAGLTFLATNFWARSELHDKFARLARAECPQLTTDTVRPDTQFLRVGDGTYVPVYKPPRMLPKGSQP